MQICFMSFPLFGFFGQLLQHQSSQESVTYMPQNHVRHSILGSITYEPPDQGIHLYPTTRRLKSYENVSSLDGPLFFE